MKLHLGCGQNYLNGYVNIDFPKTKHTIQKNSVADRFEDIAKLSFKKNQVEEVRLHHVFEHFRRPQILAMVACWNTWMVNEGKLHIEVPDLSRIARVFVNPLSSIKSRAVAERHLFGSHEASWAAHYEGYDERLLSYVISAFGFEIIKIRRTSWRGTHNIHIFAKKNYDLKSINYAKEIGEKLLSKFLVDNTSGELEILKVWMHMFNEQLLIGWSSE
jgi:hypothetical protein